MCVCLARLGLTLAAAWARWLRPLRTLGPPAIGQLWQLRSFTWSPPLGDSVQGREKINQVGNAISDIEVREPVIDVDPKLTRSADN